MPRGQSIPDRGRDAYVYDVKEKLYTLLRARYNENDIGRIQVRRLLEDIQKSVHFRLKESTLRNIMDPSYTSGLDLFSVVAICKAFHFDIASVLDSDVKAIDLTYDSSMPDMRHIRVLDDIGYMTKVYGYYWSPDRSSHNIERFTVLIERQANTTQAYLTLYQDSFEPSGALRTLYGTPYVLNNRIVYITFINPAIGDVYIMGFDFEHYRSEGNGTGIYFRKGILLCQSRDRQALLAQNFVFLDREASDALLKEIEGLLRLEGDFVRISSKGLTELVNNSEGKDREDLEYLLKTYPSTVKEHTERVVSIPFAVLEMARIDQKDISSIIHALLLIQQRSLDPIHLEYGKNQMISHYFEHHR